MQWTSALAAWIVVPAVALGCAAPDDAAASGDGRDQDTGTGSGARAAVDEAARGSDDPACERTEAFAEQLVDTGIVYDHEPSSGPADLAGTVDIVLRGELTGEVSDRPAFSSAGDAYIRYEIAELEVLAGEAADGSGIMIVSVPYDPDHADAHDYAEAAAPGVPVIVFASAAPHGPGGLVATVVEGFLTGCEGGALLGWFGERGEWSAMTSLDDVAAAVSDG